MDVVAIYFSRIYLK